MFKQIVVAVDGSVHGYAAVRYSVALAERMQAELEALFVKDATVIHAPHWRDFGPFALPTVRLDEELDQFFETRGEAVLEMISKEFPHILGRISEGQPELVILQASRAADLVAIGAQGEHREENEDREHLGLHVERIVRRVQETPVLVAPSTYVPCTRIRLVYCVSNGKAISLAADLARLLALPLEVAAIDQTDPDENKDVLELLGDHGVKAETIRVLLGTPDEDLREVVVPGDLVVLSGQDFDFLGDALADLPAPFIVAPH